MSPRSVMVTGIGELVTGTGSGDPLSRLGIRRDAALVARAGLIEWIGQAARAPSADLRIDCGGASVLPGFVDSHTHLAYAGDRSAEFAARMTGQRYDGGGIAATVAATRALSAETLRALLHGHLEQARQLGTSTVEIKSGYGLDIETEERLLRVAREVTPETTFLGAHVVPPEYHNDRAGYLALVTGPMLRACAPHARWVDVFCEPASVHAFDGEESRAVLEAGIGAGLLARVHGNQLGPGPGVLLAVELGAASVDHCTYLGGADVAALVDAREDTVATLLPGVEFSTKSPYPDARALLDSGVSVALASDINPGTHNSSSMPFVIALAVREMGMTPAEAVLAATAGGAKALRRTDIGRIEVGARADLTILDAPTYLHLAYRPGMPLARVLTLPE